MNKSCEKCKLLKELYERTPKSNRDYWLMTEVFVLLHNAEIDTALSNWATDVKPNGDICQRKL
jgi:hypothetical protein